jgi:hypothetical protein
MASRAGCSEPAEWCVLTTGLWWLSVDLAGPRDQPSVVPVGESPLEQLRDVAILAMIALLFVLTLQILWLTNPRRCQDRNGR